MADVNAGTVYAKLELRDGQFRVSLVKDKQELDRFATSAGQSLGNVSAMARRASTALLAIGTASGVLGTSFVKAAADMEQTTVAFTNLLHSGDRAKKMLDELRDFAAKTPFQFTDLTQAAKRMMALGFEAERVIPILTSVGDAASAMGTGAEGVDRIITALGQMRAKSKVSAEEMMQLTEAGIPAWEILSKAIGASTAETMKLAEKGVIPADRAIQALLTGMSGTFGGQMAEQAKTFNGQLSNLQDEVERTAVLVGQSFLPVAKDALETLNKALSGLTDEQKKSYAEWVVYGGLLLGAEGILTKAALGVRALIAEVKALKVALAAPVAPGSVLGALAVVAGGGAIYGMHKDLERWEADQELREWRVDPATGRLVRIHPGQLPIATQPRAQEEALKMRPLPFGLKPEDLRLGPPTVTGPKSIQESRARLFRPSLPTAAGRKRRPDAEAQAGGPVSPAPVYGFTPLGPTGEEWRESQQRVTERTLERLENQLRSAKATGRGVASARIALIAALRRAVGRYAASSALGARARSRLAELQQEVLEETERTVGMEGAGPPLMAPGLAGFQRRPSPVELEPLTLVRRQPGRGLPLETIERLRDLRARWQAARDRRDGDRMRELEAQITAMAGALIREHGTESAIGMEAAGIRAPAWDAQAARETGLFNKPARTDKANLEKLVSQPSAWTQLLPGLVTAGITAVGGGNFADVARGAISGFLGKALGPWGAPVMALANLFLGSDREAERRHKELMRQQEEMVKQLERANHSLTPVSDYFRSAGFDLLPGSATFGGSLEDEIARGPRL